ncbi:MAG: hypothetical protein ACRDGU_01680 [Actinomycetota bacterium]
MKKAVFVAVVSVGLVVLLGSQALATVCINVSKKNGAGNVGDVIISAVDGSVLQEPTNPGGQVSGGFADVYIDFDGSLATTDDRIQVLDEAFNLSIKHALEAGLPLPELPDGAHAAAGCGKAVDDAFECP